MAFGPLLELIADRHLEDRLATGDRMERKRVLSVFAVLDDTTITENLEAIERLYRLLGSNERQCLCAGRGFWARFEANP